MPNIGNFSVSLIIGENLLQIENIDIVELCIFEDIYDFCMNGYIIFVDKIGHLEALENDSGSIPLRIEWKESSSTSEPVSKTFIVYYPKIIASESQIDTMKRVKWYFMDNMYTALTNKHQHSKVAWGLNVKGSTLVEQLSRDLPGLENKAKFKQFEETETTFNMFCTQNRTIAESIKWIKKRCKSTAGNAGYLFYNNSLGTNFVTMQTLINNKEREKDSNGNVIKYVFDGVDDSTNKILHWSVSPPETMEMDYLGGQTMFGYGGENGKKINEVSFSYKDIFLKGSNEFGTNPLELGPMANARSLTDVSNRRSPVSVESDPDPVKMYNLLTHNFISRYMLLNKANIIVRGDSSRYAGMMIDIDWKSSDKDAMTNKMMEGLWIVKSITHQFIPSGVTPPYRQLLVCIKPGYNQIENDKSKTDGVNTGGKTSVLRP